MRRLSMHLYIHSHKCERKSDRRGRGIEQFEEEGGINTENVIPDIAGLRGG